MSCDEPDSSPSDPSAINDLKNSLAANELVALVDDANEVIGSVPRGRVRAENLLHRATYIFVFNTQGQLLVQLRTATKDLYPAYFDAAAGGVVGAGESYDECAERELGEELGIGGTTLRPCFEFYYEDSFCRCFGKVYRACHDGPFRLQAEEVQNAEFVDPARVVAGEITPLTPDTLVALERLLNTHS